MLFRRLFLVLVLAFGAAVLGQAAGLVISNGVGGTFLLQNQTYQSGLDLSLTGIGLDALIAYGDPAGIFFQTGIGFPISAAVDAVPVDLSVFNMRMMADILAGAFYRLRVTDKLSVLLGGGANFAYSVFVSLNTPSYLNPSMMAGIGAICQANYLLGETLGAYASVKAAYDFFEVAGYSTDKLTGGFALSASLGLSFRMVFGT